MAKTLRKTVLDILHDPPNYNWEVQGFGILRTYLDDKKTLRLHIWHHDLRVPIISDVHNHPWDFCSNVIIGQLENVRYLRANLNSARRLSFNRRRIVTGVGTPVEDIESLFLRIHRVDYLEPGDIYVQNKHEIHRSIARNGTVTVIDREFLEIEGVADTFYPTGLEWVSAKPRPATEGEIDKYTKVALSWIE